MNADSVRYFLLAGLKRWRVELSAALRKTPLGAPLRVAYRVSAPVWRNRLARMATVAVRRRLYRADPRAYWHFELKKEDSR